MNHPIFLRVSMGSALILYSFLSAIVPLKSSAQTAGRKPASIKITSSAFQGGGGIPVKYTCEGEDISPPLAWSGVPNGAKSLALICDDPDAPSGTWVHWVLSNLPVTATELAGNIPTTATLPNGAKQGTNDFGKTGYGGPCPPPGKAHRYFFKLYALDGEVSVKAGATKQDLLRAMEHHLLGEGQLIGTYQRKK